MTRPAASGETRLLKGSQGNLDNDHLSITGHLDFVPPDCFGPSRKPANAECSALERQ